MTCSDFYAEPHYAEREPDVDFMWIDWYFDESMQKALLRSFLGRKPGEKSGVDIIADAADAYAEAFGTLAADAAKRITEAMGRFGPVAVFGGRSVGKTVTGMSMHAAWADEAERTPVYVPLHTEHWHYDFGPYGVMPGYKGRAATRREARGKDPYDDPSRDRTSPTGFRPARRTGSPRNHESNPRRRRRS